MQTVTIRPATADDVPWIVERHGTLYAQAEGFDDTFGPLVASILEEFFDGHDPAREAGWIAERAGTRLGCIFCVALTQTTGKLRLFLVVPEARGLGVGRLLLRTLTDFAKAAGYADMTLWTHESHRAACGLYAATGWRCIDSKPVHSFGRDLVEQTWTKAL